MRQPLSDRYDIGEWLTAYLGRYRTALFDKDVAAELQHFRDAAIHVKSQQRQLFFAGNGASAAIASHAAVDFTKQAGVRATTFNDADLITCFANDFGYDRWIAKAVEFHAQLGDVVVLISCSGRSASVVQAADVALSKGLQVVTFTGFAEDNPLKSRGHINFWLDSRAYNIIECVHMIWITTVVDLIIGDAEYSVS
jgi:D-sedoheptulose 7-phosphate isomerase